MRVGDLVKLKSGSIFKQKRVRANGKPSLSKEPINGLGLIIEESFGAAKVIFPPCNEIHTLTKSSLELVNENR